jgi:hypothetical protein
MTWRSARRVDPRADRPAHRRWLATVGVTVALGASLAGCASSAAHGLALQACRHVDRSLALYRVSLTDPNPALAARQRAQASAQLQDAQPLATVAAGQAPQWQALMATLAENARLPESDLVVALKAQCAAAENGGALIPNTPNTTLPPPSDGP